MFPSFWKESIVCPIPKVPNTVNVEEHRPITLISTPAKFFETLLYEPVFEHFEPNLSPDQYGFVPKRGTNTNLANQL